MCRRAGYCRLDVPSCRPAGWFRDRMVMPDGLVRSRRRGTGSRRRGIGNLMRPCGHPFRIRAFCCSNSASVKMPAFISSPSWASWASRSPISGGGAGACGAGACGAGACGAGACRCLRRWCGRYRRLRCRHGRGAGLVLRGPPGLLPTLYPPVHGAGHGHRGGGLQYAHRDLLRKARSNRGRPPCHWRKSRRLRSSVRLRAATRPPRQGSTGSHRR